jgi:agmatinase
MGLSATEARYHESDFVILPIAYNSEAQGGAAALIRASSRVDQYDLELGLEVSRQGIYTAPVLEAGSEDELVRCCTERSLKYQADGKFVAAIGGDDASTEALFRSLLAETPSLSLLHLDAHADLQDGQSRGDAPRSVVQRLRASTDTIVSVGVRSLSRSEMGRLDPEKTFLCQTLHHSLDWVEGVVHRLSENVYVSIDLDVLDPAIMPSVASPEPGGISWYQLMALLRRVAETRHIVGADIVGLAPMPNFPGPDYLAAKLLYKVLTYRSAYNLRNLTQ